MNLKEADDRGYTLQKEYMRLHLIYEDTSTAVH